MAFSDKEMTYYQ